MSMTKKAVTMLAVFLTAFALIAAAVPMVMAQASNPTVLFTGRKNLSGAFVISDSSVVPEDSTLYVKKGGKLYIKSGAELIVNGTLKVAAGGGSIRQGESHGGRGRCDFRHRKSKDTEGRRVHTGRHAPRE